MYYNQREPHAKGTCNLHYNVHVNQEQKKKHFNMQCTYIIPIKLNPYQCNMFYHTKIKSILWTNYLRYMYIYSFVLKRILKDINSFCFYFYLRKFFYIFFKIPLLKDMCLILDILWLLTFYDNTSQHVIFQTTGKLFTCIY